MKILFTIPTMIWLLLSALFFAGGEYLSKKFAINPNWKFVLLIIGFYILGTLAWLPAILQKNQLSIVGAIWSVLSLLATVLIGVLVFSEKLNTIGIIGIVFGVISILLLSIA